MTQLLTPRLRRIVPTIAITETLTAFTQSGNDSMVDIDSQFVAIRNNRKFADEDKEFLGRRGAFARALGVPELFQHIDHFGLYAGAQTIASKIVAYEMLRQTLDIPGHIVEFGVWNGSTLLFVAKLLGLLRPSTAKLLFGFDNFSGLPPPHPSDGAGASALVGRYKGNEEILRSAIALFGLEGWVHLVKGDALETIPAFEKAFPDVLVSLAWIDFDLYEPCKAALKFLSSRIAKGGIIVFDEAILLQWPGETIAMREFLEESGSGRFRLVANTIGRQPTVCLVREA